MLPRRLSGVARRCEQLAGAKERGCRASRNVVAEECQCVDGDRATDGDEGSTDSMHLLAMRRALCGDIGMHLRSSELKAMRLLHGNGLGCLLGRHFRRLRVGQCSRPKMRAWCGRRGGDAMA